MSKYTRIEQLITKEADERKEMKAHYITDKENTGTLRANLTERRWEQYTNGEIDRETANGYAITRANKKIDKYTAKEFDRLLQASEAPAVVSVSISVEWKRSRLWGMCPTASAIVTDESGHVYRGTGRASGCGYDKESAAVADALNGSPSILRMLCDCKEEALKAKDATGRMSESNAQFIAYGAGYGSIPYFEGGVGMSAHERVFNACGLRLAHQSHGHAFDCYDFEVK